MGTKESNFWPFFCPKSCGAAAPTYASGCGRQLYETIREFQWLAQSANSVNPGICQNRQNQSFAQQGGSSARNRACVGCASRAYAIPREIKGLQRLAKKVIWDSRAICENHCFAQRLEPSVRNRGALWARGLGSGRSRERAASGAGALGSRRARGRKVQNQRKPQKFFFALRAKTPKIFRFALRAKGEVYRGCCQPARAHRGTPLARASETAYPLPSWLAFLVLRFEGRNAGQNLNLHFRSRRFSNCSRRGRWQRSGRAPGGVPQVRRDAGHRRSGPTCQSNALLI